MARRGWTPKTKREALGESNLRLRVAMSGTLDTIRIAVLILRPRTGLACAACLTTIGSGDHDAAVSASLMPRGTSGKNRHSKQRDGERNLGEGISECVHA